MTTTSNDNSFSTKVTFGHYSTTLLCDAATASELIKLLPRCQVVENEWVGNETMLVARGKGASFELGEFQALTAGELAALKERIGNE